MTPSMITAMSRTKTGWLSIVKNPVSAVTGSINSDAVNTIALIMDRTDRMTASRHSISLYSPQPPESVFCHILERSSCTWQSSTSAKSNDSSFFANTLFWICQRQAVCTFFHRVSPAQSSESTAEVLVRASAYAVSACGSRPPAISSIRRANSQIST